MTARRGITIYRKSNAPILDATGMMSPIVFPSDFVRPSEGDPEDLLAGQSIKVLYRQSEEEGGFSLVHVSFKSNFMLPRHSHDVDCLYYVVSGSAVLGSQVLIGGDGFFVPGGAPYQYSAGPEGVEVLEFRHARSFNIQITESNERFAAIYANATAQTEAWSSMVSSAGATSADPHPG